MDFRNDLLTEQAYAQMTGRNVRSIQRERARREGPPFIRIGRRVFYRKAAIADWLLAREQAQPRAKGGAR